MTHFEGFFAHLPFQFLQLGRGRFGEAIGFNPLDGLLYHASGFNGNFFLSGEDGVIFESIDPNTQTIVDIPIVGTALVDEEPKALTFFESEGFFLWKQGFVPGPLFQVTEGGVPTLIGQIDHVSKGLAFN